ncbi:MAG: hypothetical protein QXD62_02985 [Candidatus Woesearchaeota archaeon]
MILYNKEDLENLVREYKESVKHEFSVLAKKREFQAMAKSAIFALHRKEKSKSEKILKRLEEYCKKIKDLTLFSDFLEEFFEAELFYYFIKEKRILDRSFFINLLDVKDKDSLKKLNEIYIGSLSDFTGELVRLSVNSAIKEKYEIVKESKECVELIYSYLVKCDLGGELRRKFDSIRWNLDKINELLLRKNEGKHY